MPPHRVHAPARARDADSLRALRSLLIAAADEHRLAEALKSGADAILVDLAQAAAAAKAGARAAAARFLKEARGQPGGPALIVRVMRSILARSIPISTQ